jgi:choline dehydrogenase-like flavoprotein
MLRAVLDVDVCVVGTGPAGALVAAQLAATGKRVVMVEAGTRIDTAEQGRRVDVGAKPFLLADNDARLHVPLRFLSPTNWKYFQVRRVGGNSRIWGGSSPRGLESQFKPYSTYGVSEDWPISYADLEPFYCDAEDELGVSGDDAAVPPPRSRPFPMPPLAADTSSEIFKRACAALGFSSQTSPMARATRPYRGREVCKHCNLNFCSCCPNKSKYQSDDHVDEAIARGATLLTETVASRLELGDAGRAAALHCYLPDRSTRTIRAGTFVLACNAFGNARILLLSRRADPRFPASDATGRYFMGHPVFEHHARLGPRVLGARNSFTVISRHLEEGPHIREAAGVRMLFSCSDQSATMHGLQLAKEGLWGRALKDALRHRTGHGVRATVITDCLPRPENALALDEDTQDYFGQPGLEFRYTYSEYEQAGRRIGNAAMMRILEVLEAQHLGEFAYDMAHQMGTTRMGTDRARSVVDPTLRVHGLENVYIAGGSVFPNALGPTNPTLTIAALSLRLAAHLKEVL